MRREVRGIRFRSFPGGDDRTVSLPRCNARPNGVFNDALRPRGPLNRATELSDVEETIWTECNIVRAMDVVPCAQEFARGVKNLDPLILTIRHEHSSIMVDKNPVRNNELGRSFARLAKRAHKIALLIEAVDSRVSISVGHEYVLGIRA